MTRAEADRALAEKILTALPDVRSVANWAGEGKHTNPTLQAAVRLLEEAAGRLALRASP